MAKNISSLLQRGNLTPKERYILLIQNNVAEGATGKRILTEADEQALDSWQPKTTAEAREWNKYNDGWKLSGRMGIEAEFVYAETKAEHFRQSIISIELAFYPYYRERRDALKALKRIRVVDITEAVAITNKQREAKLNNGLDFDLAVYKLAFESVGDEIRKDILTLDPDAETKTDYLDDEETIANLFKGKETLTKEAKEKIAELVAERAYNEHKSEYQLHDDNSFAEIPIIEIAMKWAKEHDIKPSKKDYEWLDKIRGGLKRKIEKAGLKTDKVDMEILEKDPAKDYELMLRDKINELLEDYANNNQTTVKEILKATCLKWLDEGLLVKEYTPSFNSTQKNTYSGDTKHPHDKVFKEWLKAKDHAKKTLQGHIDKGELLAEETGQGKTIIGESLYSFKGEFKFVREFKEQVDNYQPNLEVVYADDDPERKGENLDQELLITNKDKEGKPTALGIFGKALDTIERHFTTTDYFKEADKDGETYLEFKHDTAEGAFKETRQSLVDGYAKLLAFQQIFKRLSKTYNADLVFLIDAKVEQVSEFIDQHNDHLERALTDLHGFGYNKPLKTKEDLYIDKEGIAPDPKAKEEYESQLESILGDDF